MRNTFLISIIILFLAGCKKNKFESVPHLKYESVNTKLLSRGQDLRFTLSFTDAEGDVSNSLTVIKEVKRCLNGDNSSFVAPYPMPVFPSGKNQKGDIIVTFPYTDLNPLCPPRNDTAIFKFVLIDKAAHVSDTAVAEPVVITN